MQGASLVVCARSSCSCLCAGPVRLGAETDTERVVMTHQCLFLLCAVPLSVSETLQSCPCRNVVLVALCVLASTVAALVQGMASPSAFAVTRWVRGHIRCVPMYGDVLRLVLWKERFFYPSRAESVFVKIAAPDPVCVLARLLLPLHRLW